MKQTIFSSIAFALAAIAEGQSDVLQTFNDGKCELRKIAPDDLIEQMLGPITAVPQDERVAVWEKTKIPERMRGIWWHSYTTTVNTFLYDEPPKTTLTSFLGSKTKTAVDLMHANAWSSKDQGFQGGTSPAEDETAVKDYTANRKNSFKYVFNFDKIDGSSEYNWAHVMPSIYGQESPSKMFAMYATDVCANCREQSASNNPKAGSAHARTAMSKSLTGAQTKAQTCQDFETASGNTEPAQDQCWRRISNLAFGDIKTGDKSVPTIGFSYDVIKIVDQYGDKIQPNFDNWVAALRKINRDYIVLPTGDCTDTAEVHEAPKTIDWQKSYRGPFAHQDDEKSTDDEYVYDDEATGTDNEYTTDEETTGTDEEDANDEETTGTDEEDANDEETTGTDEEDANDDETTGTDEEDANDEETTGADDEEDTNDDETTGTDEEDTSDDDTRAHRLRGGAR